MTSDDADRAARPYHHGDLEAVVLTEVLALIAEVGPTAVSLRELARRAGVAHTSITHHFGSKAGLFAAVAAQGHRLLADELRRCRDGGGSFLDVGVAYARFASSHRSHFEVMFRPDLYEPDAAEVADARRASAELLYGGAEAFAGAPDHRRTVGLAGWALVHGLATLWHDGAIPPGPWADLTELTRAVAVHLTPPAPP